MGINSSRNVTDKDKAILDLKIQRDKLKQYSKRIQVILTREVEIAKLHLRNGNHHGALLALKKKKYQEQLLTRTDNQLHNLEEMTLAIEFALIEQQFLKGLEAGNQVLKSIHQEMSLENVEKLMADTADAIEYQAEIEQLISGNLTENDQQDIMDELDAMVEQETASKLPNVTIGDTVDYIELKSEFPKIPTNALPIQSTSKKIASKEALAS